MNFTPKQKTEFLDNLALKTQQGIWMTEMALMKHRESLAKKKAMLEVISQKLVNKEYPSARDGKNELKFTQDRITALENEIKEAEQIIVDGQSDLVLIEQYRKQPEPSE